MAQLIYLTFLLEIVFSIIAKLTLCSGNLSLLLRTIADFTYIAITCLIEKISKKKKILQEDPFKEKLLF